MSDERDDVVVLVDEDGEEVEFEHLDTIEMNGKEYVVLLPLEEETEENTVDEVIDEVIILKVEHIGDDEDSFTTVEDENELNSVFEEFKSRMEEEYDFEDK
jgi:uncharacterized protein YrzB (UPF0473 family)